MRVVDPSKLTDEEIDHLVEKDIDNNVSLSKYSGILKDYYRAHVDEIRSEIREFVVTFLSDPVGNTLEKRLRTMLKHRDYANYQQVMLIHDQAPFSEEEFFETKPDLKSGPGYRKYGRHHPRVTKIGRNGKMNSVYKPNTIIPDESFKDDKCIYDNWKLIQKNQLGVGVIVNLKTKRGQKDHDLRAFEVMGITRDCHLKCKQIVFNESDIDECYGKEFEFWPQELNVVSYHMH